MCVCMYVYIHVYIYAHTMYNNDYLYTHMWSALQTLAHPGPRAQMSHGQVPATYIYIYTYVCMCVSDHNVCVYL